MGTAGMGDCLAGTVLSLITLANKDDRISSILFAVGIHSLAADIIKGGNWRDRIIGLSSYY